MGGQVKEAIVESGDMMEAAILIFASLSHQTVRMRMEIDTLAKCLDDGHHLGDKLCAGDGLEVFDGGLDSCLAEISKKPVLVLEEEAQHFGNDEYDLTVRGIQKKPLLHPFTPFLKMFGVAGGAETTGSAGKVEKEFLTTVLATNPGKAALRVAAVEIALHHLFDDRPKIPVLFLEAVFIL